MLVVSLLNGRKKQITLERINQAGDLPANVSLPQEGRVYCANRRCGNTYGSFITLCTETSTYSDLFNILTQLVSFRYTSFDKYISFIVLG